MQTTQFDVDALDPLVANFYKSVLTRLIEEETPFMAGGGFAFGIYSGIVRDTKDFDLFVMPETAHSIVRDFTAAGFKAEITDEGWLGKIFCHGHYIDLIFGFRNGIAQLDDVWFQHARAAKMFHFDIKIVPPEELLWSKCFIATRERYDGADIAHLLLKQAPTFDWNRLLDRFAGYWRLLYANLILFGFIYPNHRHLIPKTLLQELAEQLAREEAGAQQSTPVCRGTLLSPTDYLNDVNEWGFLDAMNPPITK